MKKLNKEALTTRRAFLKKAAKGPILPLIAVYLISKSTPPLFGQSSSMGWDRPEPI